jgi:hypothetical protein
MASLNIAGKTVQVGDEFLKLSAEQQNDVVAEIASSLGIKPSEEAKGGKLAEKATGVAKALGTGLAKGVADVAGLPGHAAGALGVGADWLAEKAGLPPVSLAASSSHQMSRTRASRQRPLDALRPAQCLSPGSPRFQPLARMYGECGWIREGPSALEIPLQPIKREREPNGPESAYVTRIT